MYDDQTFELTSYQHFSCIDRRDTRVESLESFLMDCIEFRKGIPSAFVLLALF